MSKRVKIDRPFTSVREIIDLVDAFETCELAYEYWTHRAHIAVAAIFLLCYRFEESLQRIREAIPAYNRRRGDPGGYHETLTVLYMRIVAHELDTPGAGELPEVVNEIADRWPLAALHAYYSPDRLWSPEARAGWVEPDLQSLDF